MVLGTAPAETVVLDAARAGLRPDPELTVSEWADRYRYLAGVGSAEPGRWRTERTPYLREIMDSLSADSDVHTVVMQKGAQIGATEAGNNWMGYVVHHVPGAMLYVMPTVDLVMRTSKQRIQPTINETPVLRARIRAARKRDSGNTMLVKEFPGGILVMTGANSSTGLRSTPVRYLFGDEVDSWPPDVDGEGDPMDLAERRTATYERNRKVFLVSTPTIRELSPIERAYQESDQRKHYVMCPHCGDWDWIQWRNIKWKPKDLEAQDSEVWLECASCGRKIPEWRKPELLASGEWRPTAEPKDPGVRGYHLSSLYSPLGWYSWLKAGRDFLRARRKGREAMKTWTNTVPGETFEDPGYDAKDAPLYARREQYPAEVPAGALLLVAAVDVQADRLEYEVTGYGLGEECWGIEYGVLHGDPLQDPVWNNLTETMAGTYRHENGHVLSIRGVAIDAGAMSHRVYEYVRKRGGGRMFCVKGRGGKDVPLLSAGRQVRLGKWKRGVPLYTVGVDEAKAALYGRLNLNTPGPGYCHFPMAPGYDPEYFEQLTAERRVRTYTRGIPQEKWIKKRERNEALDIRVYSMAALHLVNPNWRALAKVMAEVREPEEEDQAKRTRRAAPPRKRKRIKRRDSFTPSWRRRH